MVLAFGLLLFHLGHWLFRMGRYMLRPPHLDPLGISGVRLEQNQCLIFMPDGVFSYCGVPLHVMD